MSKTNLDGLLATVPLFSPCKTDLKHLCRLTNAVTIPAGQVVARQGQLGREFIVIVQGHAAWPSTADCSHRWAS
jgi:hypothetical protein